jgi:hypothetical protein
MLVAHLNGKHQKLSFLNNPVLTSVKTLYVGGFLSISLTLQIETLYQKFSDAFSNLTGKICHSSADKRIFHAHKWVFCGQLRGIKAQIYALKVARVIKKRGLP